MLAALFTWKIKLAIAAALLATIVGFHLVAVAAAKREGYDNAISDIAARNQVAARSVLEAVAKVRDCRDSGGAWDQHRGLCNARTVRYRFGFL